ncbi:MAG: hypothetical protein KY475_18820 [Planctomycetes bacterium]|nr:hypothetical protein [Planctomycetota bacterium]
MKTTKRSARPKRTLSLETLERREMFASAALSSTVLTIRGDSWNNDARVDLSGGKVKVEIVSTPRTGFALTPDVVRKEFSASSVKLIKFYGYDGNDRFVNNLRYVPSIAEGGNHNDYLEGYDAVDKFYGGAGNDTLKGYGGNDLLHGGSGNDVIYGGAGNDDLYGDGGRDKLYGEAGLDGLYGGAGADELRGGAGADRFLVMSGASEHKDAVGQDAVIHFKTGDKSWSEEEIEDVDLGLRALHHKTGNDNLLELKNGGSLTFQRYKSGSKSSVLADNNSAGRIRMYDSVFASPGLTALTTVHEIAHNWDNEHSKWSQWQKESGWRSTKPSAATLKNYSESGDGKWWHQKSVSFARSYGKTNPYEDFATSWESYFVFKHGMTNSLGVSKLPADKVAHLDSFFASLG